MSETPTTVQGASRIGLVVVTYSPGESLGQLLDSVAAAYRGPVEVVLADNGSIDGSVEAASVRPGVRLLRTGGNLGYGAAANAGVQVLDPDIEWVVVANPDIVLGPGSIDALLEAASRHPGAGAFGPLITTPDGVVYPSARHLPSIGAGVAHALLGWWWPTNPWTRTYRQDAAEPSERIAGWLSGSLLLVLPGRWVRPRLFHVLRGRRSRGSARPGRLVERVLPQRAGDPQRRSFHRARAGRDGQRPSPQRLSLSLPQV